MEMQAQYTFQQHERSKATVSIIERVMQLPESTGRGLRFVDRDGICTFVPYAVLKMEVQALTGKLHAQGVGPGDRVGLILPDPRAFIITFLAIVAAGGVAVPMASRLHSGASSRDGYVGTILHIASLTGMRLIVAESNDGSSLATDVGCTGEVGVSKVLSYVELCASKGEPRDFVSKRASDPCFIQFTSGSTSMPKGVVVTHGNLVANAHAYLGPQGALRTRPDDRVLGWLPLYHDMGLMCLAIGPLVVNLEAVLLPTDCFARRPHAWMKAMSAQRGTLTFAPNFAYEIISKVTRDRDLAELDLSHVRVVACGAEPINAGTMRQFQSRFALAGLRREAFVPCYGMAEATVAISFHVSGSEFEADRVDADALQQGVARPVSPSQRARSVEVVSCGRVVPGHQIKIIDKDGRRLGEREVGEVCFAGASVTIGYFDDVAATRESYRDGWLHTGDLGYLVQGCLHICGRLKDVVIINGQNYYPQDIEWLVGAVPGTRPNKVIAFSDMSQGKDRLVICVETQRRADECTFRRAIALHLQRCLGLSVTDVVVLPPKSLPMTSSGKVQRRKAKRMYQQGQLKSATASRVA